MNQHCNNTRIRPLPVNLKTMSSKTNTPKKSLAKTESSMEKPLLKEKGMEEGKWRELTVPEKRRLGTWR